MNKNKTTCPLGQDSKERHFDVTLSGANGFSGASVYSDCIEITLSVTMILSKSDVNKIYTKDLDENDLYECIKKRK